ncbi:MAG: DUF1918 domain-containing protein [Nocardioidaceae bacterium]
MMQATVGDEIRVHGRKVGEREQRGEIVEVQGPEGTPPYLVRFSNGHERLFYPGPDCEVKSHSN